MTRVAIFTIVLLAVLAVLIGKPSIGKHGLRHCTEDSIYFEPYWSDRKAWSLHRGEGSVGTFVAAFYWRDIQRRTYPSGVVYDSRGLRYQQGD